MSCSPQVVVSEIACNIVEVATPGPQGIQGQAGSGSYTTPTTVAALPSSPQGTRAFVTDATGTTFGAPVVGGGSNVMPVFFNGTQWIIG
jgi:hypothetical protein